MEGIARCWCALWRGLLRGPWCSAYSIYSGTADLSPQTVLRSESLPALHPPTVSEVEFLSNKNIVIFPAVIWSHPVGFGLLHDGTVQLVRGYS
mgnify:CR=1 FL=1